MHPTSALAAPKDFLLPQIHFQSSREVRSSSHSAASRSNLGPHNQTHAASALGIQDNSLTYKNLQRLPVATTPHSKVFIGYAEAPVRDGLRTPPEDDMNTTTSYQTQQLSVYHPQDSSFPYAPPHTVQSVVPSVSAKQQTIHRREAEYKSQQSRSLTAQSLSNVSASTQQSSYIRQPRQSPKDVSTGSLSQASDAVRGKSVILPNLQIPSSINNSGGSLGEFAAQITCLFWFESTPTLQIAENWTNTDPSAMIKRLVPDAIPSVAFRKWVVTILSTTQVTQNVILLALLFIYRLKTLNPKVKGKTGSEYRLLTVALMLGNKFLDDNTYTNKTWAEVSGISVSEIHVMEVEFLSNMRYSLLASEEQWTEWQIKLSHFSAYFEKAAAVLPSPIGQTPQSLMPSPPASMQSSPPALSTYPSSLAPYNYSQSWSSNYVPPLASPLASLPDSVPELNLQPVSRKRSYDVGADEPPAKRMTRSTAAQMSANSSLPAQRQNVPRLPLPNLSVATQMNGYPAMSGFQQNMPLLPPLGSRAMSTVYPTTPSYPPQSQASLTPTITASHSSSHSLNGLSYGTPSRRQSPRSVQDLLSMNSSPVSGTFPSHNINSPSFFLQQRSSPYRPVRPPNTLLYPPPSASMHNYPPSIEQMHYQPLGKRNDYRTGLVPEYAAHLSYSNWPALPQPNFQV